MTARQSFLGLAAVVISIFIVARVDPDTAGIMTIILFAVLYAAWKQLDRR
jgi:hypothetical protein